jgi:biopolymer transport protein TolQ
MEGLKIVNSILTIIWLQTPQSAPVEGSVLDFLWRTSALALIILLLLLVFSVFSWAIVLRKWLMFRHIAQQNHAFVLFFRKSARLSEVASTCELYHRSPLCGIFSAGYRELNAQIEAISVSNPGTASANPKHPVLSDRNVAAIQRSLFRASAAELSVIEKSINWLATTGSVTPFIGLLGTVLGIISAFQGLGMEKTASIQAVAPGIAEALIATAAGLGAAIPAVIAYNHFISKIKNIAVQMDDFSSEFLNLVERSFS